MPNPSVNAFDDPDRPPMGAWVCLRSDFDLSEFSPKARVVLRAMKRYGMFVADNGSDRHVQGTRDQHRRNALLHQPTSVPADTFEAVDASACRVSENSGRAECPD